VKIIYFTAVLCSIVLLAGCISSSNGIFESDVLKVGIYPEMPPYQYKENGELKGFEIELIEEIAKRMGKSVEFVETDYKYGNYIAARDGSVDCSISAITKTTSREEDTIYSRIYLYSYASLVAINPEYESLTDFSGKKLGVVEETVFVEQAESYKRSLGLEVVTYKTYEELHNALISGEVDGILTDYFVYQSGMLNQNSNMRILENTEIHYFGIVTSKDNEDLINEINYELLEITKDGTYAKLQSKYSLIND